MTNGKKLLHSIHNFIHIDKTLSNEYIILGSNAVKAIENTEDKLIEGQVRIINGLWTQDMKVNKILPILDSREIYNNKIEIGNEKTLLNVDGYNINIGNNNSKLDLYGSNVNIGVGNTQVKALFNEVDSLIEFGTLETKSTNMYSSNIDIYGSETILLKTENLKVNDTIEVNDVSKSIKYTINEYEINDVNSNTYLKLDETGQIDLKTGIFEVNVENTSVNSTSNINLMTDKLNIDVNENKLNAISNIELNVGTENQIKLDVDTFNVTIESNFLNIDRSNIIIDGNIINLNDTILITENEKVDIDTTDSINNKTNLFTINEDKLVINNITNTIDLRSDDINIIGYSNIKNTTPSYSINDYNDKVYLNLTESSINIKSDNDISFETGITKNISTIKNTLITPLYEVNNDTSNVNLILDNTNKSIKIGTTKTLLSEYYGNVTNVISSQKEYHTTPIYEINGITSNAYFKIDKNFGRTQLGSDTTLETKLYGANTTINASLKEQHTTKQFDINTINDSAYMTLNKNTKNVDIITDTINLNKNKNTNISLNENTSKISIGKDTLSNVEIKGNEITIGTEISSNIKIDGNNITIGNSDTVTTIYGNVITYGSSSNLTINSTTTESAAFAIRNTGTDVALIVSQNNILGEDKDVVQFVTVEDQDRTALRIDGEGHVGIGYSKSSNIEAWMHITRKDPMDTLYPMLRVDDYENDKTPFIIQTNGYVGVGKENPEYDMDIKGDLQYSGTFYSNGIDILQRIDNDIKFANSYVLTDVENSTLILGGDSLDNLIIKASNIELLGLTYDVNVSNITYTGDILNVNVSDVTYTGDNLNVNFSNVTYIGDKYELNAEEIIIGNNNSTTQILGDLVIQSSNFGNNDLIKFITSDNLNAFRIDADGHVGIGVTNESNIQAWFHITRTDLTDVEYDLFRVDDLEGNNAPFIIKPNGFVGIGTTDPLYDLDIRGDLYVSCNLIVPNMSSGIVAKPIIEPSEPILYYTFTKQDIDIENYGVDSNLFKAKIYNFNKQLSDITANSTYQTQDSLVVWYKFEPTNNNTVVNHASYNDISYNSLGDPITENNIIENDVVYKNRGNQQNYSLYVNADVLLDKGEAYAYIVDANELMNKIKDSFTLNMWLKTEDITLDTCSIFQINYLTTKILDIRIKNSKLSITIQDTEGNNSEIISTSSLTNKLTNVNIVIDLINLKVLIYFNAILDSENLLTFNPNFSQYTLDLNIKIANEITNEQTNLYIEYLKIFDYVLTQTEIYALNGYDEDGNRDKSINVDPEGDYLLDVLGNVMIRDTLYINNDSVNKIFYTLGGARYVDTDRNSLCITSVIISWSNDVSDFEDVYSYVFRLACKFHVSGNASVEPIAYRKFEIFISPINNDTSPKEIVTTEINDTKHPSFVLVKAQLERKENNKGILNMQWRNLDEVNNSARAYLDIDILAHIKLGTIKFEPFIDIYGNGIVSL